MKKIIALLTVALALTAVFSGCAETTPQSADSAAMPQTQTEAQTEAQTLPSESVEQTLPEDDFDFSSQILSDPSDICYTDVPGMPTQDFVLSFEDVRNGKTHDVTLEEPDKLTSNALSDICAFNNVISAFLLRQERVCNADYRLPLFVSQSKTD